MSDRPARRPVDGIDLYWIPLGVGAGGALVRWSGRGYEAAAAALARRPRAALFHSALEVHVDGETSTIEMAPVWTASGERGAVCTGSVGLAPLGRWRWFRYEVRCWPGGTIPDLAAAIGGPTTASREPDAARAALAAVGDFPNATWGRDELGAGEMWNSNSLTSWVLVRAGVDVSVLAPPGGGRAPGWHAGSVVASRGA